MLIESFDVGGSSPKVTTATKAVIKDDYGNPICVIVVYEDGPSGQVHYVLRPDDKGFKETVESLGSTVATVLSRLNTGR